MIEFINVQKRYGNKYILNDLNFSIKKGSVIGLLGECGSGKTTIMKIMSGIIDSYQGQVLVNGQAVSENTKSIVSMLTENNSYNIRSTLQDVIRFYRLMFKDFNVNICDELLKNLDLEGCLKMQVKELSKGMLQKFRLILVISRDAQIYLLDEPLGGLDVLSRDDLLKIIGQRIDGESTVLISTHMVAEVEKMLESVLFVHHGRILAAHDCEEIRLKTGQSIENYLKEVLRNERITNQ